MENRQNEYYLPYTTEEVLKTFDPVEKCENLGLLLDKYMPKYVFEKPSREDPQIGKTSWLLNIFKPKNGSKVQDNHIDVEFARNAYSRWQTMLRALGVKSFDLILDQHIIIGLGGETVLETDITLHHLYGIPTIPGSALKGLTRTYVSEEYKEYYIPENLPEEQRRASKSIEEDHCEIKRIFGTQTTAGNIVFFDALPLQGQATFVLDIMNPHYPNYYSSLQSNKIIAPANDQQPNPISFLTVKDTTFTFAIAPRQPKYDADVEKVKKWLQEALQKYGIGGKTSSGYGYFKAQQHYNRPRIPQFRKGETLRGMVIDEKIDPIAARYTALGHASKCLQYLPFSSEQLLILIDVQYEEAKQWKARNISICQFVEERVEGNRTLLICEPKKKNK